MDSLELYVVTFNCARCLVDPATLGPRLFDACPRRAGLPDLVVVSLQEISPIAYSFLGRSYLQPYYDRVADALQVAAIGRGGTNQTYQNVVSRNVGMTAIMLFAKTELLGNIERLSTAAVGLGLWNMGNKGAVGVRFAYRPTASEDALKFVFVAAHLAHMEVGVYRRNQDWENIVRNLVFEQDVARYPEALEHRQQEESAPLLSHHSGETTPDWDGLYGDRGYAFIAGDLNYRTSDNPPGPNSFLEYPQPTDSEESLLHFRHLLKNDQLERERRAGRTLHGFTELEICFPPTYKHSGKKFTQDPGDQATLEGSHGSGPGSSGKWAWAKHRFPSWCDRILFLSRPAQSLGFTSHGYMSLPLQATSDHQPVALSLSLNPAVALSKDTAGVCEKPPFPINPNWKSRQHTARRKEMMVGVVAFLTTTNEGLAMSMAMSLVALAAWYALGR